MISALWIVISGSFERAKGFEVLPFLSFDKNCWIKLRSAYTDSISRLVADKFFIFSFALVLFIFKAVWLF